MTALLAEKSLLDAWDQRLDNATRNLVELQGDFAYKLLTDSSTVDGLSASIKGETRNQLAPLVAGMLELWKGRGLVQEVVDKARERYETYIAWARLPAVKRLIHGAMDEKSVAAEIDRLLNGDSVVLPPLKTLLAQRKLTTAASIGKTIRPEVLFQSLEDAFAAISGPVMVENSGSVRTLASDEHPQTGDVLVGGLITYIVRILRSWTTQKARLATAINALVLRGDELGLSIPEANEALQALEQASSQYYSDPLLAQKQIDLGVDRWLQQARQRIDAMVQARSNLSKSLADARQVLEKLVKRHAEALAKAAERQSKIAESDPSLIAQPCAQTVLDSCVRWLKRLEVSASEGKTSAVIGLTQFIAKVSEQLRITDRSVQDNEVPIQQRRELKDLFNCLQVKVAVEKMGRFEEIGELSRQAAAALARPTNLVDARRLVTAFEEMLR